MELHFKCSPQIFSRVKAILSIPNYFCFASHFFKFYYISESKCWVFADKSASYDCFNLQVTKANTSRLMVQHTLCSQSSSEQLTCSGERKVFISKGFALLLQTIQPFPFNFILLGFVYSSAPLLFHLHCASLFSYCLLSIPQAAELLWESHLLDLSQFECILSRLTNRPVSLQMHTLPITDAFSAEECAA